MLIELSSTYDLSYNGDIESVETIEIQKPTMEGWVIYSKAKSLLLNAFANLSNRFKSETPPEDKGVQDNELELPIEAILLAFDSYSLEEYQKLINEYLYKYAKFNGKIKVNKANLKKLTIEDYNKVIGVVSGFLLNT
jgi:hypothetical protein